MKVIIIMFIILKLVITQTPPKSQAQLDLKEFVNQFNYSLEDYEVQTDDGYILRIHRLNSQNRQRQKSPVVLYHGLLESSDVWFLNRQNSLPFLLEQSGHDVWLPNFRGNTYSRRHASYNPDLNPQFWRFTYDEISKYDISATIRYISNIISNELGVTNAELNVVAYSQSAIPFLMNISQDPAEIDQKVSNLLFLAPVVYYQPNNEFITQLSQQASSFSQLYSKNMTEVFSKDYKSAKFNQICITFSRLCLNPFLTRGTSVQQMRTQMIQLQLARYQNHYPAGTSLYIFEHLKQIGQKQGLFKFDYGPVVNQQKYGLQQSPQYNLSSIINFTRLGLIGGEKDLIAPEESILKIESALDNSHSVYYYFMVQNFNHVQFMIGDSNNEWSSLKNYIVRIFRMQEIDQRFFD